MIQPVRIPLESNLQHKKFFEAMKVLRANQLELDAYTSRLFRDLEDGYDMFGRGLSVSVKQLNHICTTAWEIEEGRYRGKG